MTEAGWGGKQAGGKARLVPLTIAADIVKIRLRTCHQQSGQSAASHTDVPECKLFRVRAARLARGSDAAGCLCLR